MNEFTKPNIDKEIYKEGLKIIESFTYSRFNIVTLLNIERELSNFLSWYKNLDLIYDFRVICDGSNNLEKSYVVRAEAKIIPLKCIEPITIRWGDKDYSGIYKG